MSKKAYRDRVLEDQNMLVHGFIDQLDLELRLDNEFPGVEIPSPITEWCDEPNGLPHVKRGRVYYFKFDLARRWIENRLIEERFLGRSRPPRPTRRAHK